MKTNLADANKVEIRKPTDTKLLKTKQEDQWAKRQIDPASLVSVFSEIKKKNSCTLDGYSSAQVSPCNEIVSIPIRLSVFPLPVNRSNSVVVGFLLLL